MEDGYSLSNFDGELLNDIDDFLSEHAFHNGVNDEELTKEQIEEHNKTYDFPKLKHEWVPYGNNFDICYEIEDLL